ncbi:MAG: hypothetical protein R3B82_15195 [Sandaracinaceae bacterium]
MGSRRGAPSARPPSARPPSTRGPVGLASVRATAGALPGAAAPALKAEATNAARPSAMGRDLLEPVTDELSLDELDSADLAPVHFLEGEPTRARPETGGSPGARPVRFPPPPEPVSEDDAPTLAFHGSIHDADGELEGAPTSAHGDIAEYDPPTYDAFPAPVYEPTPFAEPEEPLTSPKPKAPVEATPHAPPSGQQRLAPAPRPRKGRPSWLMPAITGGIGVLVLGVVAAFGITAWLRASGARDPHRPQTPRAAAARGPRSKASSTGSAAATRKCRR